MRIDRGDPDALDLPDLTITQLVLDGLEGRDQDPVLVDGPTGQALTAVEFRDRVERLAGGLSERGIGPGRAVALFAPNQPDWCVLFHAIAWAGGTVTTLNPSYTAEEVHHQLRDSGAVLLITSPDLLRLARTGAIATSVLEIAVIGEANGAVPLASLLGDPLRTTAALPESPAVLPYSSGTTGLPKGVVLTHRNLVANVLQIQCALGIGPGDATLAFLPYFHIYGMTVLMNLHLAFGGTQVTLPRFDLESALRLIERHRVRHLFVAPPVVLALARHPLVDHFDLSCLRLVISGAAPLGADLEAACARRVGCPVAQGYGMTELSPVSHFTRPGQERAGSSGQPLARTECRLVDPETGADVAAGEAGEVWVRGPQVMRGYHGNSGATAEMLTGEGWLRTGDIARVDADGYLFVIDRVKELIKVSGFQVAPAEIEALLVTHPGVADVAVIGVPDEARGEVPKAFVVRATGASPSLEDLRRFLEGHVAPYKIIQRLEYVERIPRTPSGKILRRLLRAPAPAFA